MNAIVTFYSFKGGVGRTMALANIAVLLARRGLRVLAVDWDLEAPGLHRYFAGLSSGPHNGLGLIDLLLDVCGDHDPDWRSYAAEIDVGGEHPLNLLPAGLDDDHYAKKVLGFSWSRFFKQFSGGEFLESLRARWREEFDIVLIDSRTGLSESGGICTIQMPDILVPMFTCNAQSLQGAKDVVARAMTERAAFERDRPPPLIFPLASRFDGRSEFQEAQGWLDRFADEMGPFYGDWLPAAPVNNPRRMLEITKLPYIAFFSFGEKLPVVTHGTSDPEGLGHAYAIAAKLIEDQFADAVSLLNPETGLRSVPVDDRSSDVRNATTFISYSHDSPMHEKRVLGLANRLRASGVDCAIDQYLAGIPVGGWPLWIEHQVANADYTIVVLSRAYERRLSGDDVASTEGDRVTWAEADAIRHLSRSATFRSKTVPVVFDSDALELLPEAFSDGVIDLSTDDGYVRLLRRIRATAAEKPPLGSHGDALKPGAAESSDAPWTISDTSTIHFVGRDDVLSALREELELSGRAGLSGLGGSGKTQIALEYARRFRACYPNGGFWVTGGTESAIKAGFVEIARTLALPGASSSREDAVVQAALRWLEINDKWLLILDDVEDLDIAKKFFPQNRNGHLVLTSREATFQALGSVRSIVVPEFTEEEAVRFLTERTGLRQDADAAEIEAVHDLAVELGFFPLALEQAAAYISANASRFGAYLEAFRRRRLQLLARARIASGAHAESVTKTFEAAFEATQRVSSASADVLRASAFLNHDRIPLELLREGADHLGPAIAAAFSDLDEQLVLDELLAPLLRYGLIRRYEGQKTFSVHRLVQDVVRSEMHDDERRMWLEYATDAVNAAFPEVSYATWDVCERLVPHVQSLSRREAFDSIENAAAGRLLNNAAQYLNERGRWAEAQSFFERALAVRERVLGPDHLDVADTMNYLAILKRNRGNYDDALGLYRRVLEIRERALGHDDQKVAQTLNNLGVLLRNLGRYEEAEELYLRAIEIFERSDDDTVSSAVAFNNFGVLRRHRGDYEKAFPLLERALAIRERILGSQHPDIAHSLSSLALLYLDQERYAEAESLLERALEITESAVGPEHPDIARTLNDLARLYRAEKRFPEAAATIARALAIKENAFGPGHPDVAVSLTLLADLANEQGDTELAVRSAARALAILEQTRGPEHSDTVQARAQHERALAARSSAGTTDDAGKGPAAHY